MYFFIQNKATDLVLDVKDRSPEPRAPVVATKRVKDGHVTQHWEMVLGHKRELKYFFIRNKLHTWVVDVEEAKPKPGPHVIVFPEDCDEPDNQLWVFIPAKDRFFFIHNQLTDLVLEHKGPEGSRVVTAKKVNNNDHQLWYLVPACDVMRR